MLKAIRIPGMGLYPAPILFLLLVFAATHLTFTPLAAAGKKRATVILDLSSSMSGPISGSPRKFTLMPDSGDMPVLQPRSTGKRSSKITEVKRALGKAYRDFSPRLNLGLVAFGHRTPGSCSDIQTIEPVGPVNPKRYRARTNALKTVGVSPISDAILHAANNADYKNKINTFILITDSVDSCSANLCKLGGELRNSGANLTVHVIAIGLAKAQQRNLRCLAGHTRGHFFGVSSKQQLTKAIYDAFNGASISSYLKPEPAPSVETIAEAEKAPGASGANMTALIAGDIPQPRRKPKAPRKPESVETADMQPEAAPGKVEAPAEKEVRATAPPPPAKGTIPPPPIPQMTTMVPQQPAAAAPQAPEAAPASQEGRLTALARIIEGSAPLESGVRWNVYTAKGNAPDRKVAGSSKGQPEFSLPDGKYIVKAALGYAKASANASVNAGQLTSRDLVFNAGGIKLSSVIAGKTKLDGVSPRYSIKNTNNLTIAENLSSSQIIYFNPGDYTVTSHYGNVNSIVTAKINVQPGKLTEATLNHSAGRITFKLTKNRGDEPFTGVQWKFSRSDGEVVATSTKSTPRLIFANGTYKATAKQGGKVYRSSFIVRPGEDKVKEVTTE